MARKQLRKEDRLKIHNMFHGHCAYCGTEIKYEEMQVDHVHPLRKGGIDEIENMMPACRSCNHYKSTLTIEEFRLRLQSIPDVLLRDNVTYKIGLRFGILKCLPNRIEFYFEKVRG